MSEKFRTQYDFMREADNLEEDAFDPDEWERDYQKTDKEKYFEFYDDIKTTPKDDW
ncbi:MAG: hypothetical protein II988_03215 [Clostridia bacterium]|nr:hypothetical protein [Clostridia bacterium]